jgi:hypothetical protein
MDQASRDALFGVIIDWDDGESPFNEEFEAKLARLARQQQAISATMTAQVEPTALLREMHCREIKLRMELVQFCSLHSDELVAFYGKQIFDYQKLMSFGQFSLAPHSRNTAIAPGDRAQAQRDVGYSRPVPSRVTPKVRRPAGSAPARSRRTSPKSNCASRPEDGKGPNGPSCVPS